MDKAFALFLMLVTLSCSSPQKILEKGQYEKAFKSALRNLEKGKSVNQNKAVLTKSMDQLLIEEQQKLEQLKLASGPEQWEKSVDININLQKKIGLVQPYLGDKYSNQSETLRGDEMQLRVKLFEIYLQNGQQKLQNAMESGQKVLAQQAYHDFIKARQHQNGGPELDSLINKCYQYGIINYFVEADARFDITYNWEIDRVFDDIENYNSRFKKIYYEIGGRDIDCEIDISLHSLDFEIAEYREIKNFEKEVIDGYNTVVDTAGQTIEEPIYITVVGQVAVLTRVKTGTWRADVNIYAKTKNCNLGDEDFNSAIESEIEVFQLSGDLRAIPDEYKNTSEEEFMQEDDMAEELLEQLYERIVRYYF